MSKIELLIQDLPDADAARRFLDALSEKHPSQSRKLVQNDGLLSDVLTLVSYSPLLATTLLQNPEYIPWLNRKRIEAAAVRNKEELLESLARFSLTNSQLSNQILFARFRRRELLRIFLRDIRRLATVAEITEEISNLADAILENALRVARQELDNRFGSPLEIDEKNREKTAEFCIVSLGKLGSKELNYSSDIDLLFLYSAEGKTSGSGTRGQTTNREYFNKLAETITKLVGEQTGEGATYRVDLRLRPHGRVGPLAMSVKDTTRYYISEAASWERQVLIRSRASAGDSALFKRFFAKVESSVFSTEETVDNALQNVRSSKQKIDLEKRGKGFDVKLGKGGIREIEFIAQALQLAYGGRDRWLRAPHTLISLSRLADRNLITEAELTELYDAYQFFRHLEHILQMENGLQTHTLPQDEDKRSLIARRMKFESPDTFKDALAANSTNVSAVFSRVFETNGLQDRETGRGILEIEESIVQKPARSKSVPVDYPSTWDFHNALNEATNGEKDFGQQLSVLRQRWSEFISNIKARDRAEEISLKESKRLQTQLAEASIEAALKIARGELEKKLSCTFDYLPLAVMGLGKLGGAGIDYESDLDLVLVYETNKLKFVEQSELYSRFAEIFVTTLSSITRDGHLYRVDLRLRPHGKNGPSVSPRNAFSEYMQTSAAIWELLAFVKIRGVGGDIESAKSIESEITQIIHERALKLPPAELANETHRIRMRLEQEKAGRRAQKEVDIKFGSGGMLDVYFAIRFLQLRDNVPEDAESRSSDFMLSKLHQNKSLADADFKSLLEGYTFLSLLDHNLRLIIGRSTRLPTANQKALENISARMKLISVDELLQQLTLHRLNIRASFENVVSKQNSPP